MRKLLLSAMALLLSSALMAGPVGKDEAQSKALDFLNGKVSTQTNGSARVQRRLQNLSLAASEKAYHVFNVDENGGFVIVSGSDLTPDIIGYADEGSFDAQNIPDNMKAWLAGYAEQIEWAEAQGVSALPGTKNMRKVGSIKSSIAPLIQTTWNQDAPYYNSCPNFSSSTDKCVTGCVATAMAQVLNYWKFPTESTTTIDAYVCDNNWSGDIGHISVPTCSATTFEWGNMENSYVGITDVAKKAAVAKLMLYCGASVHMQYANGPSGGSQASVGSIPEALKTYFGFDCNVRYENRKSYSTAEWENLIYDEIAAGRPVIYGGLSIGGGHAFVCDGYDADGFFHINWGWGGAGNGNFLLSALTPDVSGIGGSSSYDGFTMDQQIVRGIQTPTGKTEEDGPITLVVEELNYTGTTPVLRSAPTMTLSFTGAFRADFSYSHTLARGLAFYDGATLVKAFGTPPASMMPARDYTPSSASWSGPIMSELSVLTAGKTYQVKAVTKLEGSDEWIPCTNSDKCYILATVSSDNTTVTFSSVNPTTVLNASDIKLATDGVVNTVQTVTATITNTGTGPYHSNVYMFVDGVRESGNEINVEEAGGKSTAMFSFKPTSDGSKTIEITTDAAGTQVIGAENIMIGSGDDSPALTSELKMNVEDNKILGDKLKAVVTLTNATAANYVGQVVLTMMHELGGGYWGGDGNYCSVMVPASSSIKVPFECDATEYPNYIVRIQYMHNGAAEDLEPVSAVLTKTTDFISYIKDNGDEEFVLATSTYNVPKDAVVVDLRGQSVVTTLNVPGDANPNCLYLADSDPISGITKNWVKGTTAVTPVELTDDGVHGFYTPMDFTAAKITYTRTFMNGSTGNGDGWETIDLPFTVTNVKQGGKKISWFTSSSDTDKDFWLYRFSSDGKNQVNFAYETGTTLEANVPYLINMPSGTWGEASRLTGVDKPITFEGSGEIKANEKKTQSAFYYMFAGGSQAQEVTNAYVMNDGKLFKKCLSAIVKPFRAYFYSSSHNLLVGSLAIGFDDNSESTGIRNLKLSIVSKKNEGWYTLSGTKLIGEPTGEGIYIHNGKKVVIK